MKSLWRKISAFGRDKRRTFAHLSDGAADLLAEGAGRLNMRLSAQLSTISHWMTRSIPFATERAATLMIALSNRTLEGVDADSSVVRASIPVAARRSARIIRAIGEAGQKQAQGFIDAALPRRGRGELLDYHFREIGRITAMSVRNGLDPLPISNALAEHFAEIRDIEMKTRADAKGTP